MTETLAHGYSSEIAQGELYNEYQHDRVSMFFIKSLLPCALDESSLGIVRVNPFKSGDLDRCCLNLQCF